MSRTGSRTFLGRGYSTPIGAGTTNLTAPSAKQSVIFAFSAEDSKLVRLLAHFLRLEGTGEA